MAWTTPGTATAGEVLTAAFWNTQVRDNLNMIGTWQTWSPTLTGITVGNGLLEARYIQAGKTIAFNFYFKAGSTSTFSATNFSFTLPATARFTADLSQITFNCILHDAGTATYFAGAQVGALATSNTIADIIVWNVAGTYPTAAGVNSTAPFTWAVNDKVSAWGVYESA